AGNSGLLTLQLRASPECAHISKTKYLALPPTAAIHHPGNTQGSHSIDTFLCPIAASRSTAQAGP
ncbi:MAG TPA: hypothetical protein VKZ76_04980, partial [Edaphocola sp.]|nr:hypothetical protein [Edaphocola sp.]